MTFRELIERAYEWTGIIADGESMSNEQATLGLRRLNDWLDQLSTERLAIGSVARTTFALVASQAAYTIAGVPTFLNRVTVLEGSTERDLGDPLTDDEYARIADKATTGSPLRWYYNRTVTTGTLTFYPTPSANGTAVRYVPTPISEATAITATVVIQPGYRRFFVTGLAEELCAMHGIEPSGKLVEAANDSRLAVRSANRNDPPKLRTADAGIPGSCAGAFDYQTGLMR